MEQDRIKIEITNLENLKQAWKQTLKDKAAVRSLISNVNFFKQTFQSNYHFAQKHFVKNHIAEIEISDGLEELENYAGSKLKVKADKYFYSGINNLENGLETIINGLKSEVNNETKTN